MPLPRLLLKSCLVEMAHAAICMVDDDQRAHAAHGVKREDRAHGILDAPAGVADDGCFREGEVEVELGRDAGVAAGDCGFVRGGESKGRFEDG